MRVIVLRDHEENTESVLRVHMVELWAPIYYAEKPMLSKTVTSADRNKLLINGALTLTAADGPTNPGYWVWHFLYNPPKLIKCVALRKSLVSLQPRPEGLGGPQQHGNEPTS